MPKPDYSQWYTKQQAAETIGVSTKLIERLAQDKRLQTAKWKRPEGGPAIAVYHPQDVERLAKERNPDAPAFVLPPEPQKNGTGAVALRPPSAEQFLQTLVAAVNGTSQTSQTRLKDRLYLTIDAAAEYAGLGVGYLRRQIADGKLQLLKGAGIRGADVVRRADLERL